MTGELSGKTVLITGGNSGIGKVTALELARLGAEVVIIARNTETAETAVDDVSALAKNDKVSYHIVDLGSFKSISDFAAEFQKSHKQLDILVNNAGVLQPPSDTTEDDVEAHVGINYLGHFYLTHLLSDLLVKSKGKVVVLSCEAHSKGGNITMEQLEGDVPEIFAPPESRNMKVDYVRYAVSKRAGIYFAKELIVRHPQLTAVSVHPGTIKTDLLRNAPFWAKCCGNVFGRLMKSPEQGAVTTVHCCTQDVSKNNGDYFMDSKPSDLKADQIDAAVQVKLWDVSMQRCTK